MVKVMKIGLYKDNAADLCINTYYTY